MPGGREKGNQDDNEKYDIHLRPYPGKEGNKRPEYPLEQFEQGVLDLGTQGDDDLSDGECRIVQGNKPYKKRRIPAQLESKSYGQKENGG
jgi:hypothetical protein